MLIEHRSGRYADIACDLLGFCVFEDGGAGSSAFKALNRLTRGAAGALLSSGEFKPELHRSSLIHNPRGLKARRLLLIGAGKKTDYSLARLRELAGTAIRRARAAKSKCVAFVLPVDEKPVQCARVCAEGALYGNYESDLYKTRDREGRDVERFLVVVGKGASGERIEKSLRQGAIIGNAITFTRTLANEPSNILTPSQLAERATAAGGEVGLSVEVLEREEMQKLGMNMLLAVSRGSDEPPKLIILRIKHQEQAPRKGAPLYALVGKGVTFDSGGISIKPSEKMEDMKADMAGGAAVLGAMIALAQLRPKHRVIGLIPAVENLPSGKAARPGDVVKSYLGKTVEIISTDAEGRLILADALAYARTLGATNLVDVATLTGAVVIALGNINAGILGTDQATIDLIRKNAKITGEKLWQLPLDDEYRKAISSEIADIKNVGNRLSGAITAAKFLQEFVEDTPWVHLDIAGMDLDHDGRPFAAKGATGFGARTLIHLFSGV
jgi:leucyl aminopeptidase